MTIYNSNKFSYTSLSRKDIDGKRHYVTPDGNALPSVTSILSETKTEESKRQLFEWRKRVGETRAQEITTEAASRGTRLHKWLEKYIINGNIDSPGSNPYSVQSWNMANKIIECGLKNCQEVWGTEINLFFPDIYAGTTDLVGVHNNEPCIMDFKQSNKPKTKEQISDYFLQLVAYAECHNVLYHTSISRGVIFMCTPSLEYLEFEIKDAEWDFWKIEWYNRLEKYYRKFL